MRHAVFDVSQKAARQVPTLKGVAMTDERRRKMFRVAQRIVALSRGPATPEKAQRFFRSYVRLNRYLNHQPIFRAGFEALVHERGPHG